MNREHLLDKIRALLSKTTENGCTEAEALTALAKARAMMDAYEVTETDLQLTKAEAAVLLEDPEGSAISITSGGPLQRRGRFCDVRVGAIQCWPRVLRHAVGCTVRELAP